MDEQNLAARRSQLSEAKQALVARRIRQQLRSQGPAQTIPRRRSPGPAPLSPAQQRLWFLDQLEPGSSVYNCFSALQLTGALHLPLLQASLDEIVRRHEVLRMTVGQSEGRGVEVLSPLQSMPLPVLDLSALPAAERLREASRQTREEAVRPFDLAAGPLLRVRLLRLAAEENRLIVTAHHIVWDGWSLSVFQGELAILYRAFSAGLPSPLPRLPLQYGDFAAWRQETLAGGGLEAQLDFWRRSLAGAPAVLELPTDRPRPLLRSSRSGLHWGSLSAGLAQELRELCRQEGATLFMGLLAGVLALLARYTRQDDISIGSPSAGRSYQELEELIGFFVNTLVLRTDLSGDPDFRTLLARVREVTLEAQRHQDVPFERLVEELAPERSLSYSPLFQVMVALERAASAGVEIPGLEVRPALVEAGAAMFDLSMSFTDTGSELPVSFDYNRDLFDAPTIGRFEAHLRVLLAGAVADPGLRIAEMPLLTAAERFQLGVEWSRAGGEADEPECLHRLFEAWAARAPEALAIVSGQGELTYGELDRRAGRLAGRLRRLGAGPDVLVGIWAGPSQDRIVAILAVLKAGAAYVPFDPDYPVPRLAAILQAAPIPVLLAGEELRRRLSSEHTAVVGLGGTEEPAELAANGLSSGVEAGNLAYVIYTSGSTGVPNGVLVSHRNVATLMRTARRCYGVHPGSRVAHLSSFGFDASALEIFMALTAGACLCVIGGEERLPGPDLADRLRRLAVTTLVVTPSVLNLLPAGDFSHLECVSVGGESCPPDLVDLWAPRVVFLNCYGPTEATIFATWLRCDGGALREPPIGRPVAGTEVLVLDAGLRPVPCGVPGELCIGGSGLARGYLDRPDFTATRFVPRPSQGFGDEPGARLYRTGDLARTLPDGRFVFLGRLDSQVKVRGQRIEPGEVEAVLERHPAVQRAAVAVREVMAGERHLVAYVVPRNGSPVPTEELRGWLGQSLPRYMVPSLYVELPSLPLTSSGKVDRRSLPAPEHGPILDGSAAAAPPRDGVEELVAEAWAAVLGQRPPSIHDDFFDLGGHSLLATRLATRLREAFAVDLPLRTVFDQPTVAGLAREIAALRAASAGIGVEPVLPVPRGGDLPLSFAQERLWFLDRLVPDNPFYNVYAATRLAGRLDAAVLERAFQEVVRRHEVLRTTFEERAAGAVQVISETLPLALPEIDLRSLPVERRQREMERLSRAEARRPFDLARGPLLRAHLLYLAPADQVLLLCVHHIVADGGSMQILHRELTLLYEAFAQGRPSPLRELPVQYADFAVWQRRWLEGGALATALAYWQGQLAGLPEFLDLPTDHPRPPLESFRGGNVSFQWPAGLTADLAALARRSGATLAMALLAGFRTVLSRYSDQPEVPVGMAVANRTREEVEGLIGFFVNTLVLRTGLGGSPGFESLLVLERATALGAYDHRDLSFEKLVEELRPGRDLARNPLVQVMLAFQSFSPPEVRVRDLSFSALAEEALDTGSSKLDLTLFVHSTAGTLWGGLEYSLGLFEPTTARRLVDHLENLMREAVARPDLPVDELPFLGEGEQAQLLREWNDTRQDYAGESCLHELFAAQVERSPDAVAVSCEGEELSYAALDRRAEQLAARLRRWGIAPEMPVAICVERSPALMIGLLAVLKAGGAYVPLDPDYPAERLAWMIEDSGAPLLLAQRHLSERLPGGTERVLWLEDVLATEAAPAGRGAAGATPDSLMGLLYTSGSTGRPKGVMLRHRGMVNRLLWAARTYPLTGADRVLQKAPFSFDFAVWECFGTLLAGARLVLARPGGQRDGAYLVRTVVEQGITLLHFVPSMLQAFLAEDGVEECRSLRFVFSGGEALTPELLERFAARLPAGVPLRNQYGPTEISIDVTEWIDLRDGERRPPRIGRPIGNGTVYVVGSSGEPSPLGAAGELLLGGDGVARGYRGRPDLTAERFIPDPWGDMPGARLYRTGDRVRLWPDGNLEFLGRIDHQLKIRGYRIEPGEVEAALEHHPAVERAVVAVQEVLAGEKHLVAYVTLRSAMPRAEELRGWLGRSLPGFMVPSFFVELPSLPLTPSGKVDRRSLPAAATVLTALEGRESARGRARDGMEELVAGTWAAVLGREQVEVHDNFFDLGGHSLLATQVVSRLREQLQIELPLRWVFEHPTVAALTRQIVAARNTEKGIERPALRPVPRQADLPLSFAQQRLWLLDRLAPGSPVYNIPAALRLRGVPRPAALKAGLEEIVRRHEVLRTVFVESGGEPRQVIAAPSSFPLPWVDLGALPAPQRQRELARLTGEDAVRPFDLARGPLVRATLVRLGAEEHGLLLNLHHIVSDGWSMGVLVRESAALYRAFCEEGPSPLPPLPVQYADFAVWQRQWLAGEVLEGQLAYWREELAGAPSVLDLPADRPRPAVQSARGGVELLVLPEELRRGLEALARREGATLFMVLLAALQTLLHRLSGQGDVLVGSPVANRNHGEIEGLIGFFVNTLVMRARFGAEPASFRDLLRRVRTSALGAYTHQDLPFERLVEELQVERSLAYGPLFQVMLVLQNTPEEVLELPGLLVAAMDIGGGSTAKFDLTLSFGDGAASGGPLAGSLEYNTDLFDAATARRLAGQLEVLLAAAVAEPGSLVNDLPLLREGERHQLLAEWNDTGTAPAAPLLHESVRRTAARVPDAVAVAMDGVALSYGALESLAGRLARELRRRGVRAETRVGICVERSPEMVAALLAVLAAGGAYVALDPTYPRERLAWLVDDAVPLLVITGSRLPEALPPLAEERVFRLDREGPGTEESGAGTPEALSAVLPEHLAYLIYTSGSTGRPKGVAIPHGAAAALLGWASHIFTPAELAGVLASTSINFDLSVFELFLPLAQGGTVVLAKDALELPALAEAVRVTLVNTVPSAMRELAGLGLPSSVLTVNLAGEPLTRALVEQIYAAGEVARVCNLYGPSEDTTYSTFAWIAQGEEREPVIGRAIAGSRATVLDGFDRGLGPVPIGVSGELCLGGAGLARGYLNCPDLTAERFIPDPWGTPGARLYRTGDRVRLWPDGNLEFLGRIDHQLKVRGYRIEPGEVEAALEHHTAVERAVVTVQEVLAGEKHLVAYVMPRGAMPRTEELRGWLGRSLPGFMVPSFFVELPSLPLTPSGKVDRRRLPAAATMLTALEGKESARGRARNGMEELVAGTWAAVLGRERVEVHDNFFDLGGHSLLATQLVSRLREQFQIELPLRWVFEHPTVAGLTLQIVAARSAGPGVERPALTPVPRQADLPLSFAQQRLWLLDRLEPGSPVYNIPAALRLRGVLRPVALQASLEEIVRRHEVLRTVFVESAGEPRQVIAAPSSFPLPWVDLEALPAPQRQRELVRLTAEDAGRPFDLVRGPLVRAALVRLGAEEHGLLLNLHHIVSDGWSMGVLVGESAALYRAFCEGRPSPLPELPVQYADFAVWQRQWLTGEVLEAQLAYWREALAGAPSVLDLPADRPRPAVQSARGAMELLVLPEELRRGLEALARREGATLFMVLLAALQTLLHRLSGQGDVLVGSPVANRNQGEIEGLIGFFVNTLVLRARFGAEPASFRDLLRRVRTAALGAYTHQDLPFERLVEELQVERSLAYGPLFQVMLVLQNTPEETLELPDLRLEPASSHNTTSKYDLTVNVAEIRGRLEAVWELNRDLFDRTTVQRMMGSFSTLLQEALAAPDGLVETLPVLGEAERAQLLREWNDTASRPDAGGMLVARFESQAARMPDVAAAVFDEVTLSYAELNRRANRLARLLRRLGVEPDVRVGICLERSLWMPLAVLGALKAGGVCVPLDPAYPEDRLRFMLEDAAAAVVVTQASIAPFLERSLPSARRLVRLDADGALVARESGADLGVEVAPEHLFYDIYTSGSTGRPKGIELSHGTLANLLDWHLRVATGGGRTLGYASLSFDVSFLELFAAWLTGGTLFLVPQELRQDVLALAEYLERHGIESVVLPVVVLHRLAEEWTGEGRPLPRHLLEVVSTGEQLQVTRPVVELFARLGIPLHNYYGPSESHVVTSFTLTGDPASWPYQPPIGRPIANSRIHVLDRNMAPVPVLAAGEVFLGGTCLARGYLNRPDLTAERFVPDPLTGVGERLYRTGDLGRWLPSGDVEFFGRIDHQVKIRGYRVEPAEVEAVLTEHPAVREAVVVARPDAAGGRRLVGYVVAASPELAVDELKGFLRARMPDFMVPAAFVVLESLPLTPNRKVDRRALPAPSVGRPELAALYVAPRSATEEVVAEIWKEVLGLERVGIRDNFFELGGHSLLATKLMSRVRSIFETEIPLRTLFEGPTIERLCQALQALAGGPESTEEVARIYQQVQQLSEDDLSQILGQES